MDVLVCLSYKCYCIIVFLVLLLIALFFWCCCVYWVSVVLYFSGWFYLLKYFPLVRPSVLSLWCCVCLFPSCYYEVFLFQCFCLRVIVSPFVFADWCFVLPLVLFVLHALQALESFSFGYFHSQFGLPAVLLPLREV